MDPTGGVGGAWDNTHVPDLGGWPRIPQPSPLPTGGVEVRIGVAGSPLLALAARLSGAYVVQSFTSQSRYQILPA
jgi:hypothetical protein